jgi:hypothetical protein
MDRNMHELEALGGVHAPTLSDFWTWVEEVFTPSYQSEVESYLNDCVDYKDLETRMKYLKIRGLI